MVNELEATKMEYQMDQINKRIELLENKEELNKRFIAENIQNSTKQILDELGKRLSGWVEQEVRSQLSDKGIRSKITSITESMIDRNFIRDMSVQISSNLVNNIQSGLDIELKRAKQLSYSIDSEIKHIKHEMPLNYQETQNFIERITKISEITISNTLKNNAVKKLEVIR